MKKHKKAIIFTGIIVVIVGVSAGAAIFFSNMQNKTADDDSGVTGISRLPSEKTADQADKIALENDVATGVKEFDKALEASTDAHEKFVLYSRKATLLYNHNDFAAAIAAATSAYELEKTSDSAAFVGQIAQAKGDKPTALTFYKKAVELIDTNDPFAQEDKEYYTSIITEIETGKTNE